MYSIFKSRMFWTAVVVALYNVLVAEFQMFPNYMWLSTAIDVLGVVMMTYFHVNPSQQYNAPAPKA